MRPFAEKAEPMMTRFAPASRTAARAQSESNAAADLARKALRDLRDERGVVALPHGGVEIDELDQRKARRTSSIQYSKSSKARRSFSPCTSWTMRPPSRSMEGISMGASRECRRRKFRFEGAGARDAEVEDAGGERGVGLAAREDIGEVLRRCLRRRRR